MLANFLNKSKPINFIGLLFFFFIGFLYTLFLDGYTSEKVLKAVFILLFFLTIFFVSSFIDTKNKLTLDNSYAFFLFTILSLCILQELKNYQILIETIIYLLFLRKIYSLRSSRKVIGKCFDSGFWLGILFILNPFSIVFLILIYLGIYLHNKITVHTLFTPLFGCITPLIVYFTYYFWFDKIDVFTNLFYFDSNFSLEFYLQPKYLWLIGITLFFVVFAIFFKSMKALSVNNTFRKSWVLLISNFGLAALFVVLLTEKNGAELSYLVFPTSLILANGLELIQKKIFKDVLLYLFLVSTVLCVYFF